MLDKLPPEIAASVYSYLTPNPPLPACRSLVPHFRSSHFDSIRLSSYAQLERLDALFKATPVLARHVRELEVAFEEGTEAVLQQVEKRPDQWPTLLAMMNGLKHLKCADWLSSTLGPLATTQTRADDSGPSSHLASLESLQLSALLTQLNSGDFVRQQLSVLGRYPALRTLDVVVQPYDPGSSTTNQFELFPSSDPSPASTPSDLPSPVITQVEHLTICAPLCDRRTQLVLALFSNLSSLSLFDLFSSPSHISPLLATIPCPERLTSLKLSQLYSTPMPLNLPANRPVSFDRFTSLRDLTISVPLPDLTAVDFEPMSSTLEHLTFGPGSTPSFELVRDLLASACPSSSSAPYPSSSHPVPNRLSHLTLSHLTGRVGPPLSRSTLPSVVSWVSSLISTPTASNLPTTPAFPIEGWLVPSWPVDFDPNEAEHLFPLANGRGVVVDGSVVSAMLTAYVLDKQIETWQGLSEAFNQIEGAGVDDDRDSHSGGRRDDDDDAGERELARHNLAEMEQVFGHQAFWDALALRYQTRLGIAVVPEGDGPEGAADVEGSTAIAMEE
ncbi:hypothetical protein JCM10212_000233 [Sporobolomyces blumeae]